MYMMLCAKSDICFTIGMMNRYYLNLGLEHWTTFKHILKYLQRTRDYVFVFQSVEIIQKGDVMVDKIPFAKNLIDPLTKKLTKEGGEKGEGGREKDSLMVTRIT